LYSKVFKNKDVIKDIPFYVYEYVQNIVPPVLTDDKKAFEDPEQKLFSNSGQKCMEEMDKPYDVIYIKEARKRISKKLKESIARKAAEEKILENARAKAIEIISTAKAEAAKITETAKIEASRIENEASKKGFLEGKEEARKKCEELLKEAEIIRERAQEEHDRILAGMEKEIISLVLSISRKVISDELKNNRERIIDIVRQGISKCTYKKSLILKVSCEDYDFLISNRDLLLSKFDEIKDIDIRKDYSLETGSCIVETPLGNVDAGANTKMKKIEESFLEILGR